MGKLDYPLSWCQGTFWVGTWGGGLDQFDPRTGRFTHCRHLLGDAHSLSTDTVLSLYEDRSGVLWIGTFGGGLDKLNLVQGGINHYRSIAGDVDSLSDNVVLAVQQDQQGRLWIGTADGLVWIADSSGLYRFEPSIGRFEHMIALETSLSWEFFRRGYS